ncbi:TetR/AcrR family transcriptional regulator [Dictyobacter kobayashii]|uniref:TetR family transcriptional regulator n=1 Tax=Dictyobacter kobayashii TaxID=2014872 RepID=A0A402AW58_9CHLR|nr:TetR/AcrR family transcriptional regulator [Dictyobacter kobayashii]GCE23304.1 TetR family transcriptional regulator [Dictyobacter kobayashii]
MKTPEHRSLKEKQRQEREDLILQVAQDVVLEKGYRDTSMDEIAARVGIAKGTLYLHFAKKEDLMFAFFEREMQKFLQAVEQPVSTELSAQAKLESIVSIMHKDHTGKRGNLLYILFNSEDFKITLQQKSLDTLQRISAKVRSYLEEGKARGEFDPAIPTSIMLSSFFSVLSPRAHRQLFQLEEFSHDEVMFFVQKIYFRGIAKPAIVS